MRSITLSLLALAAAAAAAVNAQSSSATSSSASTSGGKLVKLCDNQTTVRVPNGTPKTHAEGQKISDALMAQWESKHPGNTWIAEELQAHTVVPPEDNQHLVGSGQRSTYGAPTLQEVKLWDHETYKFAVYGSTVFHSAGALGSEIAVSCDMCHPNAANTHPETYPKFQPQLGRVVLLRDMINWCIEHPVRGKVLDPDDPKMRALEAYILAQRKGVPLDYGKR
ncbi:MAG TPA: hypothetical protein VMU40_01390 [Steroidobacteraceae bacterium]|nr:hypothetical protein [Steroidobacteraceae bacterium]